MTAPQHNQLFRFLKQLAQAPLPTWAQYCVAGRGERKRIRYQWVAIAHRYRGDGSQADEAMRLYLRASNELRDTLKPYPTDTRPIGDDEEYAGEADERGLGPHGFNKDRE